MTVCSGREFSETGSLFKRHPTAGVCAYSTSFLILQLIYLSARTDVPFGIETCRHHPLHALRPPQSLVFYPAVYTVIAATTRQQLFRPLGPLFAQAAFATHHRNMLQTPHIFRPSSPIWAYPLRIGPAPTRQLYPPTKGACLAFPV